MDDWLGAARDAIAEAAGIPAAELDLDDAIVATLLDLARIAARQSGTRTNAPLLTYLLGRASHAVDLDALAAAIGRIPAPRSPDGV
jgi:hypothetical protein